MSSWQSQRRSSLLGVSLLISVMVVFLTYSLAGRTRTVFLPGPTSAGHYQIELQCRECHSEAFGDRKALQSACVRCHGEELKLAEDSHPERKFTDPRNASSAAILDARFCVTCHREHRPEVTSNMGLSLPGDFCYRCHQSVGDERATHRGLAFDTCQSAGCHNFHDNRALYEDFLVKHFDEPELLASALNPALRRPGETSHSKPLTVHEADAPAQFALSSGELDGWARSAHARGGTNCSDCHQSEDGSFRSSVPNERCGECHGQEREGYLSGRHGMREAAGLEAMQVARARSPMRPNADASLSCTSCHGAHAFDTRRAASVACLGCHADEHSLNYEKSKHAALFLADPTGLSGVSCATCHLPRVKNAGEVRVAHNQNDTLRPNEKMVRAVCANCHGLGFSLDALADADLIASNFSGRPVRRVASLQWARRGDQ